MTRRLALIALGVVAAGGILVSASSSQVAVPAQPALLAFPPVWSDEDTATFEFSSPDAASYACRLDSAEAQECTSPKSYSPLAEGKHVFEVEALDSSGGRSTPATYEWTVDLTAPDLPGDIVTEAISPAGAIVTFAPGDNLDPSPGLNCGPHDSGMAFGLGVTNVSCTATDAAGNSRSGSFDITVRDTTPPTVDPHEDEIRAQQSAAGAPVTYNPPVSAHDIADASPDVACIPESGSVFPLGETDVTCRATDAAGLTSDAVMFKTIVQQGAIPAKPGIVADVPALTNRPNVSFELDLEPSVSTECRLDSPSGPGSFTQCAAGGTQTYSGLGDGAHLFTVQVTNGVGNVNQDSFAWTVDLTEPADVAGFAARAGNRLVRLSWTKPIDPDYERVRVWRKRAGSGAWKGLVDRVGVASFVDQQVSNHVRYVYRIRSFDLAGNGSTTTAVSAWPTPIVSPRYEAIVHSPPGVDWISVKKASYYNMQVWRDGRKLLSVWPTRSNYRLRSSWTFAGRRHMLAGGRITAYVWAGFGPKAAARYGSLYGQTRFELG